MFFNNYRRNYRRTKHYRRTIHRRIISVFDSVGNIITDGICVLHRRKNSVSKTVKSCSVILKNKGYGTCHFCANYFCQLVIVQELKNEDDND